MKTLCVVLAFVWMVSAATLALAQVSKSVSVAAGDLTEAVESLARQCEVDVIYSSGLVKGQKTQGVTGRLGPAEAFRILLEGTALDVRVEGEALLITKVGGAPHPDARSALSTPVIASASATPIDEVTIEATRKEKLSGLRDQLNSLEDRFYAAYNKVNDIPDYRVECRREGSSRVHVCRVALKEICSSSINLFAANGGTTTGGDPPFCTVWQLPVDYRKHMEDIVAGHPELLQLLKQRSALMARYQVVRREKFEGKIFVWD